MTISRERRSGEIKNRDRERGWRVWGRGVSFLLWQRVVGWDRELRDYIPGTPENARVYWP